MPPVQACPLCGEEVAAGQGPVCYVCVAPFHFTRDKACGQALPQEIAC